MRTILGVNFGRDFFFGGGGASNPGETRPRNLRKKFAVKFR